MFAALPFELPSREWSPLQSSHPSGVDAWDFLPPLSGAFESPLDRAGAALDKARKEGLLLEKSSSSSGYKGVKRNSDSNFIAQYKRRYLGTFETAEEAAVAVAQKKSSPDR